MSLTKETFDFLTDLNQNNHRDWFLENKSRYERSWQELKHFVREIIGGLAVFDPHINTEIDPARCMFRIYRDVRFRKDKTPYKTWLGAGISVNGRKLQGPEYYLHVQPGKSFLAVGYWRPEKEHLTDIRQEIDYNGTEFRDILDRISRSTGSEILPDGDDILVRPPSGYSADHPDIGFLKLKSFTLSRHLPDEAFYRPDAVAGVVASYLEMYPFKEFIHRAIGDG